MMAEFHNSGAVGDIAPVVVRKVDSTTNAAMDSEDGSVPKSSDLDRFLQQQRSDLMYELRRIRFGDRPVTGQNNRENIEKFISKHMQEPAGASHGKDNVPANVDAVDVHRPEAVVVEVQGVFEQRRVSSILTSNFRRHLENIIRGSIASASQRPRVSNISHPVISAQPTVATTEEDRPTSSALTDASEVSIAPSTQDRVSTLQRTSRPLQWPSGDATADREQEAWNSISQVQHEDMVYEISELLHRRLVSSALSSEFRTVMELQIQNHLHHTGSDGEAVPDFVRSIPQSQNHIHNDFSQFGIMPGLVDDNADNISITGISATAVPYTQTNMHMSREIQSLKSQMEEMKNMLRLSFDLQMDIQRAIRQEVAAALSAFTGQGDAAASVETQASRSVPVNDAYCLICMDSYSDCVLYQCGHMCVCFLCGKSLLTRGNAKCPVCRAAIRDVIRAYKTNAE
ncbi:LOW QUALITY PROTEIN: uncharacterized protein LOC112563692 [Pomacea canaliculata]|uniref:LOW QUALITY PROTEIN: uncharacterized protein LOC112563692 n=1 Tax=Pomacea canaliculata TaxID=400727 RepID=UPI000D7254FB|nr:LOW QUALITY PROTEIN: uncharacterized protein LOC112563692 [Pomacea canaliculata]